MSVDSNKTVYGIPKSYPKNPLPAVLRTKVNTFGRYILGMDTLTFGKNRKVFPIRIVMPSADC
jgi:hypothetical protein